MNATKNNKIFRNKVRFKKTEITRTRSSTDSAANPDLPGSTKQVSGQSRVHGVASSHCLAQQVDRESLFR